MTGSIMRSARQLVKAGRSAVDRFTARAAILMYHRIADVDADPWGMCVSPAHFAEHLQVIRERATVVPLGRLHAQRRRSSRTRRLISVTFDDGYVDALSAASSLLEKNAVPATVFVTTGNCGLADEFWWDMLARLLLRPGSLPPVLELDIAGSTHRVELGAGALYSSDDVVRDRHAHAYDAAPRTRQHLYYAVWTLLYPLPHAQRQAALGHIAAWAGLDRAPRADRRSLRPDEIAELGRSGLVEIGAHTVTHPPLSLHSVDLQRGEIFGSRDTLRDILGRPLHSFSYPHGEHSPETVALVREAGFANACTVRPDRVRSGTDPLRLPRFNVEDWDGAEFERRLKRWFGD